MIGVKELAKRQRVHFNSIADCYDKAVNDEKAVYYRRLVYELFLREGGGIHYFRK